MRLFVSINKSIDKIKIAENVPSQDEIELVLAQKSEVLYMFRANVYLIMLNQAIYCF